MLEAEIEKAVCNYARKQGLTAEKFKSPNKRAVPDRLFLHQGGPWCFFIEFKATGKAKTIHEKATGHEGRQFRDHEKRKDQGHNVYVCDDIELGKRIIDLEIANTIARVSVQGNRLQPAP